MIPDQNDLRAELWQDLQDVLERLRTLKEGGEVDPLPEPFQCRSSLLARFCETFNMSAFERATVTLGLCCHLVPDAAGLAGELRGAPGDGRISFRLAQTTYPGGTWADLGPYAPLRRWDLIEIEPGGGLLDGPVTLSEFAVNWICGAPSRDVALAGYLQTLGRVLVPATAVSEQIVALWRMAEETDMAWQPIHLHGQSPRRRRDCVRAAVQSLDLDTDCLNAVDIPIPVPARARLMRRIEREALLEKRCLLIECDGADADACARAALLAQEFVNPVILSAPEQISTPNDDMFSLAVPAPDRRTRSAYWRLAMGLAPEDPVDPVLEQMPTDAMGAAQVVALARARTGVGLPAPERLRATAREVSRTVLEQLAERVDSQHGLADLVLPPATDALLQRLCEAAREQPRVLDEWGFSTQMTRGTGLAVIFCGPSGTGKTTAAEALARELDQDLYRIDLSRVISKYIGETEQRLSAIFNAADQTAAILLFDEGEALFGKRTEVRDGRDRYANQEVSFLLQRMEHLRGITILTTNQRDAVDAAFLRRFRFAVDFEMPDTAERLLIWQRVFPEKTPLGHLDFDRLAQIRLSGGHIRNIALQAALQASAERRDVLMRDIRSATEQEFRKLRKSIAHDMFAGW